jgi:hypothetical protein
LLPILLEAAEVVKVHVWLILTTSVVLKHIITLVRGKVLEVHRTPAFTTYAALKHITTFESSKACSVRSKGLVINNTKVVKW